MLLRRDRPAAQGYACLTERETGNRLAETDTYSCAHCNAVIHAPVNKQIEQVGDFCRSCMKIICARCAEKRVCSPLMKRIERAEEENARSYHARRSYGF